MGKLNSEVAAGRNQPLDALGERRSDTKPGCLLSIERLTRSFYGVDVLQGVDLAINSGTITGLIGPNGAGKSTLFNLVTGASRPDRGRVVFEDRDITALSPQDVVRQGLIRTFQLARGFPKLSVFQHLMLFGQRQPGESLWGALRFGRATRRYEAELAERAWDTARRLRLDAVIDNPVTALSGGQKKLVEIGRALMAQPKMILLDEPMAGVNPSLTGEIADHLRGLNRSGITICLIEHDMVLIRELCDPVIVLAEGRTLMTGTFADVAGDTRVQEAYLGRRH